MNDSYRKPQTVSDETRFAVLFLDLLGAGFDDARAFFQLPHRVFNEAFPIGIKVAHVALHVRGRLIGKNELVKNGVLCYPFNHADQTPARSFAICRGF